MRKKEKLPIIIFVILLIALPLLLFGIKQTLDNRSNAAAADKLEAETGVLSATGVSKKNDSTASSGEYILFGNSNNNIVFDAFNRTVNNSWGSAETGGTYTLFSSTADYSVNNEGIMRIPTA